MTTHIVRALPVTSREKWLETARASSHATFFHTPYWQDLAQASGRGFQDASLELSLSDGSTAFLPLTLLGTRAAGLLRRCASTFAGCYGGPITARPVPGLELQVQRYLVRHRYASVSLVGNPLVEDGSWLPAFRKISMSTHMLRLDRDFDTLLKGFSKGHRAAYKKGIRLGIEVRPASSEDQVQYVSLYQRALERWGQRATSRYAPDFFAAVFELQRKAPEVVTTWVAAEGREVVAGGLFFYWNRHVAYWHGVSNPERYADSATTALLGQVLRDAIVRRAEWFDFNPSGGHDGVASFKKHFGASEIALTRGEYLAAPFRVLKWWRTR